MVSKQEREQLAGLMAMIAEAQSKIAELQPAIDKEKEEIFQALANPKALQALFATANAEDKVDTRLSGKVEGVPGGASITVRFPSILKRTRKDKPKTEVAEAVAPDPAVVSDVSEPTQNPGKGKGKT